VSELEALERKLTAAMERLLNLENMVAQLQNHARVELQGQINVLRLRLKDLEEIARVAGAIRLKINGHLQTLNADHWLGPELRALDAALKRVGQE